MKVLLALDGSKESKEATAFLARLPFKDRPTVFIVTALKGKAPPDGAIADFNEASECLERSGVESINIIDTGNPNKIILDQAKNYDVDLVVLGARGHSAPYRVILGSTANFVSNHAKCPVLVVRPRPETKAHTNRFNVVVAYDGSPRAEIAYNQMLQFDWPEQRTSVVVGKFLERPPMLPEEVSHDPQAITQAEKSLAALREADHCKFEVLHTVREAIHIGDAIRELTETEDCDILFIGDTGKTALSQFFLGSISRHLLHHVECSIWIGRNKDWA